MEHFINSKRLETLNKSMFYKPFFLIIKLFMTVVSLSWVSEGFWWGNFILVYPQITISNCESNLDISEVLVRQPY